MLQKIKDYFSFNKSERNGLIILLIILILVIIIPFLFPYFIKNEAPDFSSFKKEIEAFEESLKENDNTGNKYDTSYAKDFDYSNIDKSTAETQLHPFIFDPNGLSEEKWKEMGMTDKQIKTIKNYEAKGGKFYKKEDLKKIYSISESEYEVLEPYIQIADDYNTKMKEKKSTTTYSKKNSEIIELNSADTSDLKKLEGIGATYAKRIITYRTKLGGFSKKEQLFEVYGMDSIRYAGFSDFVSVNTYLITKINVNTASFNELKTHPYIGYNIALSLVNMRQAQEKFNTVADIKKSVLVTDKVFEKLAPYISVN
ncbi:MAG: helix-hairpin-helix domain-containing protein [Bacteroidota bacterium]